MDRSARSVKQNIVEGWKRNTTKEYGTFLGFSIGANAELEEDCDDIWKGVYPELKGIKGVMGEKGGRGEMGRERREGELPLDIDKLKFYPLDLSLPPVVQLKLRCKEINMLLTKLQNSLETKMKEERTMPLADRVQMKVRREEKDEEWLRATLEEGGLERLENGKVVRKGEKGVEGDEGDEEEKREEREERGERG